jgi:hypothetical protein
MTRTELADHHGSHRALLGTPAPAAPGTIDAIIVPTVRHPAHLSTAKYLAAKLGCALLTVHSGKWTNASAAANHGRLPLRHIAVDIGDPAELGLIEFETTRLMTGVHARRKDTSAKRNLGLLLAHMVGWERVVFLDDDISVSNPRDLQEAAGLLSSFNAVGLSIGGFPDNSVVCHAFRAIGGRQQSFIGGGALAVETTRNRSFFPDIYNEDWFYLLDPYIGLQPLAVTGKVIQSPYEPYREERARMEELGDVLAEGIFWLLDQGRTLEAADSQHWREFLPKRKRFIEYILANADKAELPAQERARLAAALRAALGRLALIEPEWCALFVKAFTADRGHWEQHVQSRPSCESPADALRVLSKMGRKPLHYVIDDSTQ